MNDNEKNQRFPKKSITKLGVYFQTIDTDGFGFVMITDYDTPHESVVLVAGRPFPMGSFIKPSEAESRP